jgi:hypothetical protein
VASIIEETARSDGKTLETPAEDMARAAVAIGTGAVLERCANPQAFPPRLTEMAQLAMFRGGGLRAPAAGAPARRAKRVV